MQPTYWQKQTPDQPLYPSLIWDRPENRQLAGKLYIVSGSSSGFAAAAESFAAATKAGVGTTRVLLPDSLSHLVGRIFPEAEFAPSTPSGSFAHEAVAAMLAGADWSDGLLLPGGLGKNSETSIAIEKLLSKTDLPLTIAGDALEYALALPDALEREQTVWVCDLPQAQRLMTNLHQTQALTHSLGVLEIVQRLHAASTDFAGSIVLSHAETVYIARQGNVTTTPSNASIVALASSCATWHLQNPTKLLQALTCAVIDA